MARKQRVNFSLAPEIVDRLEDVPRGERSQTVEHALEEYFGDD